MVTEIEQQYGGDLELGDSNDPRTRIVSLVRGHARVLEVGPGTGPISRYLSSRACRVTAVEISATMAQSVAPLIHRMICGDIESPAIQQAAARDAPFDYVIFADVLEHLRDPWTILRTARGWLAEGGAVLASVPNVAHWSIRLALLRGRWDYADGYLMDWTHLRWFTRDTLWGLFAETGYRIVDFQVRWAPLPGDRLWRRALPFREHLYAALAERWPGFWGYQFVVRAEAA